MIPPKDGEPLDTWDSPDGPYVFLLPLGRMSIRGQSADRGSFKNPRIRLVGFRPYAPSAHVVKPTQRGARAPHSVFMMRVTNPSNSIKAHLIFWPLSELRMALMMDND